MPNGSPPSATVRLLGSCVTTRRSSSSTSTERSRNNTLGPLPHCGPNSFGPSLKRYRACRWLVRVTDLKRCSSRRWRPARRARSRFRSPQVAFPNCRSGALPSGKIRVLNQARIEAPQPAGRAAQPTGPPPAAPARQRVGPSAAQDRRHANTIVSWVLPAAFWQAGWRRAASRRVGAGRGRVSGRRSHAAGTRPRGRVPAVGGPGRF